MLRLSKLADYATVVMVYLAKNVQKLSNARDIATKTHLSLPTVSKLLKALTTEGLLISVRGVAGGYRLARSAADISVSEIIYAFEAHRGFTECSLESNDCALKGVCTIQDNWRMISRAIEEALDNVSLSSLAQPVIAAVEIEKLKKLANGASHG